MNAKRKILIIEDNYYKYFSSKILLEAKLKIKIETVGISHQGELYDAITNLKPTTIIYKPKGSIVELLEQLQKRNINCRNTEVTLLVASELLPLSQRAFDNARLRNSLDLDNLAAA